MNGDAGRSGVTVFTCVRDASEFGGGVTSVALPIHIGMYQRDVRSRLLYGQPAKCEVDGQRCVGASGSGFKSLTEGSALAAIVHVHGLWTPFEWRACAYARHAGLPLVMSPHGMLEPWALAHKKLKKWLAWRIYQRRFLAQANLLVVNSWREYETVRNMGLKVPVAVIENGVDNSGLDSSIVRTDSRKCVLFLSRISPVKGILDLLQAWASLPPDHGYELRIYGQADAGYGEVVASAIKRLALEHSVKVAGPVFGAEKWQVYKNADLFVLPSYSENFGIVVAESLLAGVPVITSRATPWQCLESEGLGWLVGNDPSQLADALAKAMQLTGAQREQMGKKGETYAGSHFLWPSIIEKYTQTYAWGAEQSSDRPDWIYVE